MVAMKVTPYSSGKQSAKLQIRPSTRLHTGAVLFRLAMAMAKEVVAAAVVVVMGFPLEPRDNPAYDTTVSHPATLEFVAIETRTRKIVPQQLFHPTTARAMRVTTNSALRIIDQYEAACYAQQ